MNSSKKRVIELIAGILLILAVPILFFQLVGGSLFGGSGKRVIAVVNEDLGDAKDEETIEMGKEVVSILSEDSPYEWKVMARGAAVNGLKANQYDAIVYIPSDFSENVMSYDQENPEKAEFSYQVQRQGNGSAKQKVLQEIESATGRVNQKISTLYWSYVAQEMDHIKKEFSNLLTKETEFLDALTSYYKPESETLAEQMKRQKDQMEELRTTIGTASSTHDARIEDAQTFEEQLNGFVQYVEQYKDFQQLQKEILLEVQSNSLEKIQAAAATQMQQFNESVLVLEESNDQLNGKIQQVNEVIDANKEKFEALTAIRKQQVNRQLEELIAVQGAAIDRYNESILRRLEKGIAEGKGGSSQTVVGNTNLFDRQHAQATSDQLQKKTEEKSARALPDLSVEQTKMTELAAAVAALKLKVTEEDPESEMANELTQLEAALRTVSDNLTQAASSWNGLVSADREDYAKAATEYQNLYAGFASLYAEYESIQYILKNYSHDTAKLLYEIRTKESALLQHAALSTDKRKQLEKLFAQGPASQQADALLAYYVKLQQLGFMLDEQKAGIHRDETLKDEILTTLLANVVEINEEELKGWASVGEGIPETKLGMSNLSSTFAAIMSGYEASMQEQHSALMTDLDSINDQAAVLLAQIGTPSNMIASGEPAQTVGEGEVTAGQQNVGHQLLSLSTLMTSLSDRQNELVSYAVDLHGKANGIKNTSNEFDTKWNTNLEAMSAFAEDIQSFLANTYVDGQENGYVFNHFVNPLEVKGEAAVAAEMKKVPPMILFIILLISSLLIGFFSHRFKEGSLGIRLGMVAMLSLLVGLVISLYSVNMYILRDDRAIEWTIFTVLLLLASAAVIRTALDMSPTAGWIASIVLMCVYISPLLILGVPEINMPDVLSKVFLSIKYDPETLFGWGVTITGAIAIVMLTISYFINRNRMIDHSAVE
ncbi:type VII secretion protein EsaA [Sporosarcina sp. HYO08]|uniref:type VII secretion protein EsaA n=1 Tax=Sporosarcina sp. HYO08 TaxID=1759557 RepID=UPI00079CC080|nr:type VII secretion protein EsaA [Sporosarcina sp. HYO08]KXH78554.1 hypothetical protein AU377_12810 [Sporosarcina sp. HYO08]